MFNPKDFDIVTDDFEVSAVQKFDTDCYVKLFTDEKLMKNIGSPLSAEEAHDDASAAIRLSNMLSTRQLYLCVKEKVNGESAGIFSVTALNCDDTIEIGLMLLRKFHGRGFAEQITRAVLKRLFSDYDLLVVHCRIGDSNFSAKKVAIKLGFSKGLFSDFFVLKRGDFIVGK